MKLKEKIDATRMVCKANKFNYAVVAVIDDEFDSIGFGNFSACAKRCIKLNEAAIEDNEPISFKIFPSEYILDAIASSNTISILNFDLEVKEVKTKYIRIRRMMKIRMLKDAIKLHRNLATKAEVQLIELLGR